MSSFFCKGYTLSLNLSVIFFAPGFILFALFLLDFLYVFAWIKIDYNLLFFPYFIIFPETPAVHF